MKTPSNLPPKALLVSAAVWVVTVTYLAFKPTLGPEPQSVPSISSVPVPTAMCPQGLAGHPLDTPTVTVTSNVSDGTVIPCMGGEVTGLPLDKVQEYRNCRKSEAMTGIVKGCL
jgi:hypothetical protein